MTVGLLEAVHELVDEILAEDPIDFGYLTIDEEHAKGLVISSMIEHFIKMEELENPVVSMLAACSKLALENFVLNLRLQERVEHGEA